MWRRMRWWSNCVRKQHRKVQTTRGSRVVLGPRTCVRVSTSGISRCSPRETRIYWTLCSANVSSTSSVKRSPKALSCNAYAGYRDCRLAPAAVASHLPPTPSGDVVQHVAISRLASTYTHTHTHNTHTYTHSLTLKPRFARCLQPTISLRPLGARSCGSL